MIFIDLRELFLLSPPEEIKPLRAVPKAFNAYVPGVLTFPRIKICLDLICAREIKASEPVLRL